MGEMFTCVVVDTRIYAKGVLRLTNFVEGVRVGYRT